MDVNQLKELLRARSPVTLHIMSGRELKVPHTDFALFSRDGKTLVVLLESDVFQIVNVAAIESVTPASAAA